MMFTHLLLVTPYRRSAVTSLVCCAQPNIRELREDDIPRAAALLIEAFAPPKGYNQLQRMIVRTETEAGLAARLGKSQVLVAEQENGELVGSVEAFTPAYLEGKEVRFWNTSLELGTYVSALAVAPGYRRTGVASALMEDVEKRAWHDAEGTVSLQVDAINTPAISLYRKMGYAIVGRDSALSTPSSNPLVSSLFLGGSRQRSLIVLQKTRPVINPPSPPPAKTPAFLTRWLTRGRTALARVSRLRMSTPPQPQRSKSPHGWQKMATLLAQKPLVATHARLHEQYHVQTATAMVDARPWAALPSGRSSTCHVPTLWSYSVRGRRIQHSDHSRRYEHAKLV